jgi:hypothetical protein
MQDFVEMEKNGFGIFNTFMETARKINSLLLKTAVFIIGTKI